MVFAGTTPELSCPGHCRGAGRGTAGRQAVAGQQRGWQGREVARSSSQIVPRFVCLFGFPPRIGRTPGLSFTPDTFVFQYTISQG